MKVSSVGLGGPYNPLLRSPVMGQRMFDLLAYLRWDTSVPLRLNEMAILIIGRQWRSQVEWYAHSAIALKAAAPTRAPTIRRRVARVKKATRSSPTRYKPLMRLSCCVVMRSSASRTYQYLLSHYKC